jgi:hypothetical protein
MVVEAAALESEKDLAFSVPRVAHKESPKSPLFTVGRISARFFPSDLRYTDEKQLNHCLYYCMMDIAS